MKKARKLALRKIKIAIVSNSNSIRGGIKEPTIDPISGQICSDHDHSCIGNCGTTTTINATNGFCANDTGGSDTCFSNGIC